VTHQPSRTASLYGIEEIEVCQIAYSTIMEPPLTCASLRSTVDRQPLVLRKNDLPDEGKARTAIIRSSVVRQTTWPSSLYLIWIRAPMPTRLNRFESSGNTRVFFFPSSGPCS